ncbi:MAG: hypothetical protein NTZ16_09580 [Verrucomicrobia bacterium]|nr:hypothetical protein [Verrucomicrobiota bacterium]
MKDFTDKIMFVFYGLFGAGLGFLIFMIACGGWRFVVTGHSTKPWNGAVALVVFCVLGGGWGLVSYKFSDREFGSRGSTFWDDPATAMLFTKRLVVIATCLFGVYFLWQLAKGM